MDFVGLPVPQARSYWMCGVQAAVVLECAAAVTAYQEIQVHGHANAFA